MPECSNAGRITPVPSLQHRIRLIQHLPPASYQTRLLPVPLPPDFETGAAQAVRPALPHGLPPLFPISGRGLRDQEVALLKLGDLYRDQKNAQGLADVITQSRAFMSSTAKAKTAKLIRTLLDYFNYTDGQHRVGQEREADLPQTQSRDPADNWKPNNTNPLLTLINTLLTELKRLDDKMILTEVHLLESRVYRGIGNLAKAEVALTSSRTSANSIYCPPHLQAALDLQSGNLEDKDYTTAYSYFFEAFENLSAQEEESALGALKYMLLCKVMLNLPEDVDSLLTIKLALKYANMRDKALRDYKEELSSDPTIRSHLAALYDTLLEQNLLRIVEPYSVVEIAYVAETVGQERQAVEAKLSQMILDKVFYGVLDQGRGCLIVYDQPEADNTYGAAIETLAQVSKVVESLYAKTVRIA
ncbi:hypothetical protein BDZ97DRAFT_2074971 [Flammula alnicola]|nr:hypothetical protein BDZ97DRAFT_2074971 [Flammula alnicola]